MSLYLSLYSFSQCAHPHRFPPPFESEGPAYFRGRCFFNVHFTDSLHLPRTLSRALVPECTLGASGRGLSVDIIPPRSGRRLPTVTGNARPLRSPPSGSHARVEAGRAAVAEGRTDAAEVCGRRHSLLFCTSCDREWCLIPHCQPCSALCHCGQLARPAATARALSAAVPPGPGSPSLAQPLSLLVRPAAAPARSPCPATALRAALVPRCPHCVLVLPEGLRPCDHTHPPEALLSSAL